MANLGAAVAAGVVLLVAGCGGGGEDPPATATTSSTTTTASRSTAEVAYLTRVRATVEGATDADLVTAGRHACDLYGSGLTALGVADKLTQEGFDTAAAATITTAAAAVFCKQYQ